MVVIHPYSLLLIVLICEDVSNLSSACDVVGIHLARLRFTEDVGLGRGHECPLIETMIAGRLPDSASPSKTTRWHMNWVTRVEVTFNILDLIGYPLYESSCHLAGPHL